MKNVPFLHHHILLKALFLFSFLSQTTAQIIYAQTPEIDLPKSQQLVWLDLIENDAFKVIQLQKCSKIETAINQNQLLIQHPSQQFPFEQSTIILTDQIEVDTFKSPNTLKALHLFSHCLVKKLPQQISDHRITWQSLERLIDKIETNTRFTKVSRLMVKLWYLYLTNHQQQLEKLYQVPYLRSESIDELNLSFVKEEDALVTPGLKSMWEHCRKRFEWRMPEWKVTLQHGFQSDTYLFYKFVQHSGDLPTSLAYHPPPSYSGFQNPIPDIKIALNSISSETTALPWAELYQSCEEFGFFPRFENRSNHPDILKFKGINNLYETIFANELVPRGIARDLSLALKKTVFYPSPTGLRMILGLSAQESTVQWNPKLNKHKKILLRQRFNNLLLRIKNLLPGTVSDLILSEEYKKQLDQLTIDLKNITDEHNESIREYDFYIWSRQTLNFIEALTTEYQQIATVGQWFINLQRILNRLKFEPQTFGLWQINANHLIEKMNSHQQLRRVFPQIYYKNGGSWKVKREWLIDSLSGRPNARLNREKTLELIIHTHLKPRYEVHHLGDEADLDFFVAENMSGEMSTYRAAIQKTLNRNLKTILKLDGDLTYYQPYSKKISWKKPSRTYQALIRFVERHQYYFSQETKPEELARDICIADSRVKLLSNELYQKLIGKKDKIRIFPQIKSSLYNQTPYQYAKTVRMKSRLF